MKVSDIFFNENYLKYFRFFVNLCFKILNKQKRLKQCNIQASNNRKMAKN